MSVWVLPVVALVVAVLAWRQASGIKEKVDRLESDLRYRESVVAGLKEELEGRIRVLGSHLSQVAQGKPVSEDMILEGRLFDDIDVREAARLYQEVPGTVVLDVRTAGEYASGHIPGARLLPHDQIEARWQEVPKDAPNVVVHCAAGARSAVVCDYLSSQHGYSNLHNVAGGLGGWPGDLERGMPS